MSGRLLGLFGILLGFGALTAVALMEAGYLGIFLSPFQSSAGTQIFFDLVILGLLACIWMARDARARGLTVWPFVLLTLAAGSFGPLLYLVTRELRARRTAAA